MFAKARWNWLRLVLVVLLPLHVGFAQAAMVMPVHETPAAEVVSTSDGMPCHHAEPSPAPDHSSGHEAGCCDAGSCHCASACGLPVTIARIASHAGFILPPFSFLSVPSTARPPDLRPPIS
jgi:hypothetical protein